MQSSCICFDASITEKGRWFHRVVEVGAVESCVDFEGVGGGGARPKEYVDVKPDTTIDLSCARTHERI